MSVCKTTVLGFKYVFVKFDVQRGKRFISSPKPSRLSLGPTLPPIQWAGCFSPEIRRLGHEGYYSPPSGGEVTNKWSCTSVPVISLRGMDRDKIAFITGNYEDLMYPENGGT
jgi:hypothetical protein